jgi:hypothetical protein
MKKYLPIIVLMLFAAGAWAQSLGEVARQNRMKKKPSASVRLDDDNMPRTLLANAEPEPAKDADKQAADKDKDKKPADSAAQKSDKLTDQIKAQKDEIARLQRELDIVQREQRLRAAAFYADAGTQLRDQAKFAEDSRKEQAEIDGKKQALDAAQQKLADLQEQARKAGLGSSD